MQRRPRIADAAFAGRLGGNQEFIADDTEEALLKKQPDAVPLQTFSASLDLTAFLDEDLWRMALLEGWGTTLLVFLLGAAASGLTGQPPILATLYAALVNWLGLSIFTYCLAPVSGGHLNPPITLATFFAGLSTFPRTVLYITAQSTGAIVGGYLLRQCTKDTFFPDGIPGCTIDQALVSVGQLFALEFMFTLTGLFMAFGVGPDPRQAKIYGPAFGPVLVGITLGLNTLAFAILRPGYTGVSFNPARCLGLMVARNELQYHWVHWVAPLAATMLNGVLYHVAPSWAKEDRLFRRTADFLKHTFRKPRPAHRQN